MANNRKYTWSEWNWERRKKCSISFFALFASSFLCVCVDSAVVLRGLSVQYVHNGAKYGFSISEQRNRNTWLHYPMGLPHRRFNKRSKKKVYVKFVGLHTKRNWMRKWKSKFARPNGNYLDIHIHGYAPLEQRLWTNATILSVSWCRGILHSLAWATNDREKETQTHEAMTIDWHKEFAFVFDSIWAEDCVIWNSIRAAELNVCRHLLEQCGGEQQ